MLDTLLIRHCRICRHSQVILLTLKVKTNYWWDGHIWGNNRVPINEIRLYYKTKMLWCFFESWMSSELFITFLYIKLVYFDDECLIYSHLKNVSRFFLTTVVLFRLLISFFIPRVVNVAAKYRRTSIQAGTNQRGRIFFTKNHHE